MVFRCLVRAWLKEYLVRSGYVMMACIACIAYETGAPVPDGDVVEAVFGFAAAVAFDDVLDVVLKVAELVALDIPDESVPPLISAKLTTPALLVQQAVPSPQHHLSLSARPILHGVIRATPKGPLT
jgi:hypothetical protein